MADTPQYQQHVEAPGGISFTVQPAPLPTPVSVAPVAADTGTATALQGLGKEMVDVGAKINNAQDETRAAVARTDYMTKVDELRQKYSQDSDYQNAETNFTKDASDAQRTALEDISDPKRRAETALHMQVQLLSGKNAVRTAAMGQESDTNNADLITRLSNYSRDAATAPTPAARLTTMQTADADIDKMVSAGWITQVAGVQKKAQLRETVDDTDARKLIEADPQRALQALDDPNQFAALSPARRQTLVEHTRNAVDKGAIAEITNLAHFNPAAAVGTVNAVSDPSQLGVIFERGIMPAENRTGDNTLVSNKGAVGVSQILPTTARDMLNARGRTDLAALDDTALAAELGKPENSNLNRQLGNDYFQWLGTRYNGNVAAAVAGYNAGPKRADEWVKQATAQYGPSFTMAEFKSVIPAGFQETRNYLDTVWKNIGARDDGGGLSRLGQLHAAATVGATVDGVNAQRVQMSKAVAEVARTGTDFGEMFRNGVVPEPVAYSTALQTNIQAAQNGDKTAAKWVAETLFQEKMAPVRDELYRMAPATLAATVANMEAAQRSNPTTQGQRDTLAVAKATLQDVQERAKSDPISLGERARIVDQPVLVDPKADPTTAGFADALTARGAQANAVQQFYGGEYKVLKPGEAEQLKARYTDAGPEERFQILRSAGQALDARGLQAFVSQIGGDHNTSFAAMTAATRPDLARDILRGGELLKDKEVQEKAALVRPAFANKFGGQLYPDPAMQKAVETVALNLYVSRAGQNGTLYDAADTAGVEKAIEDITGKIIKRNGVKTPIAPSIEPGRFIGALDNLSQADINAMGGAVDRSGKPVAPSDIANYAVLKPLAPGSVNYVVGMRDPRAPDGFAPLFNASAADPSGGRPLVFNMAALASKAPLAFVPSDRQQIKQRLRSEASGRYGTAIQESEQP